MIELLLADGRLPSGGHAHSGGIEAAVNDRRVADEEDLRAYLRGRLATAGLVSAALAAVACALGPDGGGELDRLDAEAGARIASPALRQASRQQGRQLLRAARGILGGEPSAVPAELHHAVAMGVVAAATGLVPAQAARWAAYEGVAGSASAAVRLLGLDPFGAWSVVASLEGEIEAVTSQATTAALAAAATDFDRLPCRSAPWLDIGAERHAHEEGRLFAS